MNINLRLIKEIDFNFNESDHISFYAFYPEKEKKFTILNDIIEITAELEHLIAVVEKGEEIFAHISPQLKGCMGEDCKCITINGKEAKVVVLSAEAYQRLTKACNEIGKQLKPKDKESDPTKPCSTVDKKSPPKPLSYRSIVLMGEDHDINLRYAYINSKDAIIKAILKAAIEAGRQDAEREKEAQKKKQLQKEILDGEIRKDDFKLDVRRSDIHNDFFLKSIISVSG